MADARVEMRVGSITFSGEGPEKWVAEQMDKFIEHAPSLLLAAPPAEEASGGDATAETAKTPTTGGLAKFLGQKKVGKNQTKRFLATAEWLTQRGTTRPSTGDVTKAINDAHQPKMSNPSQCLINNVKSAYCEKDGKQFYVTPEGRKSLG